MEKRFLCFVTAAALFLLPWAAPAENEGGECLHRNKNTVGYIEPDIGKPGYSGDFVCLDCNAVLRKGDVIPALEEPIGSAMDGSRDGPGQNGSGETGGSSAASEEPDGPARDEVSGQTQEQTGQTEEQAVIPPSSDPQPENRAGTQDELQSEAPVQPVAFCDPEQEEPAVDPEAVPAEIPIPESETGSEEQSAGTAGEIRNSGRRRFSVQYPFRRVKMNPDPEIRAEAAGTLLWPGASSPLQQMER